MTRKVRSQTVFEVSPSPPICPPKPETRRVRIQLGGDDSPFTNGKPGADSQPLLASASPSNSSPVAEAETESVLPRRNYSHHSFFGLNHHNQSIYFIYHLVLLLLLLLFLNLTKP
jgi:hypothetical protein